MERVLHPFLVRVRSLRAFLAASVRKLAGMEPHDGDFVTTDVPVLWTDHAPLRNTLFGVWQNTQTSLS